MHVCATLTLGARQRPLRVRSADCFVAVLRPVLVCASARLVCVAARALPVTLSAACSLSSSCCTCHIVCVGQSCVVASWLLLSSTGFASHHKARRCPPAWRPRRSMNPLHMQHIATANRCISLGCARARAPATHQFCACDNAFGGCLTSGCCSGADGQLAATRRCLYTGSAAVFLARPAVQGGRMQSRRDL